MGAPEVMIGREDVEALLLRACPSFEGSPDRLEYHKDFDEEAEAQVDLLAGVFVRHLTALNGAGRRAEFPAVFDVIEELHIRGDKYVRDLAAIGVLEDLQNTNLLPANMRPEVFIPYWRPASAWGW